MNWRTFSVLTAAVLVLPLGAFTTQALPISNIFQRDSSSVVAQRQFGNQADNTNSNRRRHSGDRWLQQLDLSSEQSERIKEIHQESKEQMQSLHQQKKEAKEQMKSLFASNATSRQLRQQHQKLQNIHQELGTQRFEKILAIREVLTPEQRIKAAELMEQHHQNRGNRRHSN